MSKMPVPVAGIHFVFGRKRRIRHPPSTSPAVADRLEDGIRSVSVYVTRPLGSNLLKSNADSQLVSKYMRAVLTIEYNSIRVNANSVALMALSKRLERRSLAAQGTDTQAKRSEIYRDNELFTNDQVAAACTVLNVIVDELVPDESVKFIPVRTFHRVLGSVLALWKVY